MHTGVVKWFNEQKGYGFITPEAGGNDIFVHVKQVHDSNLDTLRQGDRVQYEVKKGNGRDTRPSAHNLKLL